MAKPEPKPDAPAAPDDAKIGTRWKPMGQPSHPSNAPTDGIPTTDEVRNRVQGK